MPADAHWTIGIVREALAAKKLSARELATDFYARIAKRNPELNAYLALCPERAFAQAKRIDALIAKGARAEISRRSRAFPWPSRTSSARAACPTTCGSRILEHYRAALRRNGGRAHGSGRRRHSRQDQLR